MTALECIPDEAIVAVMRALDGADAVPLAEADPDEVEECRTVLAAAAPHLVAHALHHLADELIDHRDAIRHLRSARERMAGIEESAGWLRRRAAELEGGQL